MTEHGKELTLYPEEMSLKGGIGQLMMSDADGIKLSSDGIIQIIGADVRFEAPTVTCTAIQGELIIAKTDVTLQEIESSFSMSNTYQVLSQSDTVVEGADLETFEPYLDQPEEGIFDWWELAGNIIARLVVAVAVAAVVAASILFLPVVIAVVTGAAVATSTIVAASVIGGAAFGAGTVATLATAGKDIQNQEIRDRSVYVDNAYKAAATVGAIGQMVYGAYGLATFAASLPTLLKNLSSVLSQFINGTGGYGGLALSTVSGGSTVVGGGVSIEGLLALGLSFERALELLAQGGWNAAIGYAMFAVSDKANWDSSSELREIYSSIKESPNYPDDFKRIPNGTKKVSVKITMYWKNTEKLLLVNGKKFIRTDIQTDKKYPCIIFNIVQLEKFLG